MVLLEGCTELRGNLGPAAPAAAGVWHQIGCSVVPSQNWRALHSNLKLEQSDGSFPVGEPCSPRHPPKHLRSC